MAFKPYVPNAIPASVRAAISIEESKSRQKKDRILSEGDVATLQSLTGENLKKGGHFVAVSAAPRRGFFSALKQHVQSLFHRNRSYNRLHGDREFLEGAAFRQIAKVREPVGFLPIQLASRLFQMTGEVVSRAVRVCRQGVQDSVYDLMQALQEIPALFSPSQDVSAEALRRLEMTHAFNVMLQVSNQRVDQFLHRIERFQGAFQQFELTVLRCQEGVRAFKSKLSNLVNQIRSLADRFEATRIFQTLSSLIFMRQSGQEEVSYDFESSLSGASLSQYVPKSKPLKCEPFSSGSSGSFSGLFPQPSSLTMEMFSTPQFLMPEGGADYHFPMFNSSDSMFDSDLRRMRDLLPFLDTLCLIVDVEWAFQLEMTYLVVYFSRGYYRLQKLFMSLTVYGEQVKHLTHILGNMMELFHACDSDTWVRHRHALEMMPMIDKNPDLHGGLSEASASPLLFQRRLLIEGTARLEKVGVDLFVAVQSFTVMQNGLEASGVLDALIGASDRLVNPEQQQQFLHLISLIQQMRQESELLYSQLKKVPDMLKNYVSLLQDADDIVSDILDPLFLAKLQKAEEVFRASSAVL